ncbi:MAG TPA: protein kinase [Kofleriaceae bacterium]
MLEPGALVAGKLRIEKILGEGGMGTVVAATHVGLDQRVAIKVLKPDLANQPEVVARFVREARAAAKLKSEHVCRVTDVGEAADGTTYIEMELLEGHDLASLIATRAFPVDVAADYVVQACVAIAEAHHLGIIHRDLKPANLFVTQRLDGSALVKVLDFGIATAPSAEELQITKTTTVMGSPGYMSPEHLRSARDVDARSDIWALGVILYEAVTGRLPFSATSITELAVKVVMDEPAPMTDVEPRFAAIVARCLKKPPEERYQTVAELAADLAELAGPSAQANALLVAKLLGGTSPSRAHSAARSAAAIPAANLGLAPTMSTTPPVAKVPTTLSSAASTSLPEAPPPKKRKTALFAIAAVVVLGGGAAAFALVARNTEKPAHPAHHREAHEPTPVLSSSPQPGPSADPNIRTALQALAAKKDYAGILALKDLDKNDSDIAAIVADAKKNYVAQRTARILDHVAHDDCAAAKQTADDAAVVVPEAKPDLDKAATCTPKNGKPSTPPTPTPAVAATPDQAAAAYAKGDYKGALSAAEHVLQTTPKDASALDTAVRSACALHQPDTAMRYFPSLASAARPAIVTACKQANVDLLTPVKADAGTDVRAAQSAFDRGDWTNARTSARQALKLEPLNRNALHILGVAACRLHDDETYEDVMRKTRMMPRIAAGIRRACSERSGE